MLLVDFWFMNFYNEFATYKLLPTSDYKSFTFSGLNRTEVSERLFYMHIYLVRVGVA